MCVREGGGGGREGGREGGSEGEREGDGEVERERKVDEVREAYMLYFYSI